MRIPAWADDWPAPTIREVFSTSRSYFVRIVPGTSWGDVIGFKGAAKGPNASAEFYRRESDKSYRLATKIATVNPIAPVDFIVTDTGYLFTIDNWHNTGYGKVIALYAPDGKLVRAYELHDIFWDSEIEKFSRSVSSIAWRKAAGTYIRTGGTTFNVIINDSGAGLIFDNRGAYQYCETRGSLFQCRTDSRRRTWHPFREPTAGVH